METIQERLKQVFAALEVTIYQVAKDLGENSSKFYNILSGRANPSYDTLVGLLEKYPMVNAEYIFRGTMPILFQQGSNRFITNQIEMQEIPFVPIRFHASFVETYTEGFRYEDMETYPVPLELTRTYKKPVVIEVTGNSMTPQLHNGSKVLAFPVEPSEWMYQSGGVYAVMYRDFFVIKRIRENHLLTNHYLTLHSDNPNGGSVTVPVDDLRGLWKVAKIVDAQVE